MQEDIEEEAMNVQGTVVLGSALPFPLALRTAASDRPPVRPSSALRPVADPPDRGAPH